MSACDPHIKSIGFKACGIEAEWKPIEGKITLEVREGYWHRVVPDIARYPLQAFCQIEDVLRIVHAQNPKAQINVNE